VDGRLQAIRGAGCDMRCPSRSGWGEVVTASDRGGERERKDGFVLADTPDP
jgi:hypothetical protein